MRVVVEAHRGELADGPDAALEALADMAEADGADRAVWLAKARRSEDDHPHEESPHPVVHDAARRTAEVYAHVTTLCLSAIRDRLRRAEADAVRPELMP